VSCSAAMCVTAAGNQHRALPHGPQFRLLPRYAIARFTTHMFAMRCRNNEIERRLTQINHPCANGQVERMNRALRA
jgi:hypothetical protein